MYEQLNLFVTQHILPVMYDESGMIIMYFLHCTLNRSLSLNRHSFGSKFLVSDIPLLIVHIIHLSCTYFCNEKQSLSLYVQVGDVTYCTCVSPIV